MMWGEPDFSAPRYCSQIPIVGVPIGAIGLGIEGGGAPTPNGPKVGSLSGYVGAKVNAPGGMGGVPSTTPPATPPPPSGTPSRVLLPSPKPAGNVGQPCVYIAPGRLAAYPCTQRVNPGYCYQHALPDGCTQPPPPAVKPVVTPAPQPVNSVPTPISTNYTLYGVGSLATAATCGAALHNFEVAAGHSVVLAATIFRIGAALEMGEYPVALGLSVLLLTQTSEWSISAAGALNSLIKCVRSAITSPPPPPPPPVDPPLPTHLPVHPQMNMLCEACNAEHIDESYEEAIE
jgi:hypothetical protein